MNNACYNGKDMNLHVNPSRKISRVIVALIFCTMFLFPGRTAAQQPPTGEGSAWVIPIRGDIEPSLTAFVRREARRALSQGAEYLIFEIDTFGGRVDAALQITSFIMSVRNARTIAWINTSETSLGVSWSAGALIAFACQEIYMAPGTSIGAAAPVVASPDGTTDAAGEKSTAAIRSQMAALAERNGHPVGLGLAMVDFDIELWEVIVNGETRAVTSDELLRMEREVSGGMPVIDRVGLISERGKLLSLTAGEAEHYGLIVELVESREALLAAIGASGELTESFPSAADSIVSFLTSGPVQGVLILIGLVLIFLELQSPGFGIPGIAGVMAFLLVFGSSALLGRVDSLEIILFLIGLGLLAIEIFVLPGFGIVGISGVVFIGLSLVLSMQDFVIPRFDWEWQVLGRNAMVVFISFVASVFGIVILALAGPKLRMFDRIMLKAAITGTAGGPDPDSPAMKAYEASKPAGTTYFAHSGMAAEDEEVYLALVGKNGITDSVLRPAGRAQIEDRIYTVEADGEFIEEGKSIIVTRVRGNRIIVRRAQGV